jgi:dihydroorotate dehydrogenase electron transfer subunit
MSAGAGALASERGDDGRASALGTVDDRGQRVQAPFGRRRCTVCLNEAVGPYLLVGADDPEGPPPLAGQFYMLAAATGWGGGEGQRPYLPRAFSVCRVRGHRLDFLIDDIGPGTARLARLAPGEDLWVSGPLGIGFSPPERLAPRGGRAPALLVGGGIGTAPLVVLAEALESAGVAVKTLLGFRSRQYAETARLFPGTVALATDDGSAGHPGVVTELLETELGATPDQVVYACGPPPMLEAVRSICTARSVPAQLALEEAMACGFGACNGCVVKTVEGYRRLCVDGPVLLASELDEAWVHA